MKYRFFLFALLFAGNYVKAQNTQTFTFQGNVFQIFVAPTTGWYFLDASGGQGGAAGGLYCVDPEDTDCYGGINQGGKGARLQGYVRLEAGDSLRIAVAGAGGNGTIYQNPEIMSNDCVDNVASGGGGGGASSIVKVNGSVYTPLLFAAGGGGASYKPQDNNTDQGLWEFPYSPDGKGGPGNATIAAGNTFSKPDFWIGEIQNPSGINGNGGAGGWEQYAGAGGAGYYTDGGSHYAVGGDWDGTLYSYGGQAYLSGNYGGDAGHEGGDGGWGGGGEGGFRYLVFTIPCSSWIASQGTPGGGGGGWNGGAGGGSLRVIQLPLLSPVAAVVLM